ncbi:LysR family transcriptional regulator [Paenibacillus sp. Leaf72]|uniref:LysR family transcriptional regulator n=1 Tax=Paenibacillus sp. Leaf72 TaxID=1736234 RepID=UPI000702071B|nr:LysR family transcriptional regulator [Paenibacillus sp. Leaf72]KQO10832.1 transcriptional regulator [Paenibacillus sp. Leaf72]
MDQSLLVFIAVAEERSFTRAAEALHMTQPAVSQHIQSLEADLGTKLLDRSSKYVRLNKAGDIVYRHAKEISGLHAKMQSLLGDLLHTASGALSIGASFTFGEYVLPHMIACLRVRYPLITPTITIGNTKDIAALVAARQLDIGIVEGAVPEQDKLQCEPFAKDAMYVVVGARHPYARQHDIEAEALLGEHWIMREEGSGTRTAMEKMFEQYNIRPLNPMAFGSTQIIKESVEAGLGISLLSEWAVRKEISLGTLNRLTIDGQPVQRDFSIITLRDSFHTKAAELFIEMVRAREGMPQQPN